MADVKAINNSRTSGDFADIWRFSRTSGGTEKNTVDRTHNLHNQQISKYKQISTKYQQISTDTT